jgi:hypothetical protein
MRSILPIVLLMIALGAATSGCAAANESDAETSGAQLSTANLQKEAARVRAEATALAGAPGDVPQRVVFLHEIYVDSKGNFAFPEIAAHGALWGHRVLNGARLLERLGGPLVRLVEPLRETADEFAAAIEVINRQVFIDTYTNYWFTKKYGRAAGADAIVRAELLGPLNRVHEAVSRGEALSADERRDVFLAALNNEQDETAAHGMDEASAKIHPGWLKPLMTRPILHFPYFPLTTFYAFSDFSDRDDRVRCATFAYDAAVSAGWENVADSMSDYGMLPEAYLNDRAGYGTTLRAALLGR